MSIKKYKILFWVLALSWASLCFVFMGQKIQRRSVFVNAGHSIEMTQSFFKEYSKQIKFKLSQWSYNYHLKTSKGIEFDDNAFMQSEFDMLRFYSMNEAGDFVKEWSKSKEFAEADIQENLEKKIIDLGFEAFMKSYPYAWFTGLGEQGQAVVALLVPVADPAVGEGLLLGVMDLEALPYAALNSDMYVVDREGRYLLHPQKEYIAQKANAKVAEFPVDKLQVADGEVWLTHRFADGTVVYRAEAPSLVGFVGLPLVILLLGLGLFAGLPLFLYDDRVENALSFVTKASEKREDSDIDVAGYESVLKVQSLREKLNKMSLMSSSLKGRFDLAVLGDADQKLLRAIQVDLETLDKAIDEAFHESTESMYGENFEAEVANIATSPNDEKLAAVTLESINKSETVAALSRVNKDSEMGAVAALEQKTIAASQVEPQPVSESVSSRENRSHDFAFEILEDDIDMDFATNLTLTKVSGKEQENGQEKNQEQEEASVAANSADSSDVVTASEAAMSNVSVNSSAMAKVFEDDFFADLDDMLELKADLLEDEVLDESQTDASLSALSNSVTPRSSSAAKNDWSKVIEELTEELNNLNLDLSDDVEVKSIDPHARPEAEVVNQASSSSVIKKQDAAVIKPPRIEL